MKIRKQIKDTILISYLQLPRSRAILLSHPIPQSRGISHSKKFFHLSVLQLQLEIEIYHPHQILSPFISVLYYTLCCECIVCLSLLQLTFCFALLHRSVWYEFWDLFFEFSELNFFRRRDVRKFEKTDPRTQTVMNCQSLGDIVSCGVLAIGI